MVKSFNIFSNFANDILHGTRSSTGRAPDCGSGGRGFKPHRVPYLHEATLPILALE